MAETQEKEELFRLELGDGFYRDLPIRTLEGSDQQIASFVMLGDVELNKKCAEKLVDRMKSDNLLDKFNYIVTIEAKGITIAHEIASLLDFPRFVVIRKSYKKYMQSHLIMPSSSITSGDDQNIVLDGIDIERIKGKKVCLVEDVIATGGSIDAACRLIEAAGAQVTVIASVLLKGNYSDPRMIYLAAPEM